MPQKNAVPIAKQIAKKTAKEAAVKAAEFATEKALNVLDEASNKAIEKGANPQVVHSVRDSASATTRQLATKARNQVVNSLEKRSIPFRPPIKTHINMKPGILQADCRICRRTTWLRHRSCCTGVGHTSQ